MVLWHWVVGFGLGIIGAILTINLAIENSPQSNGNRRQRRKSFQFIQNPNDQCPICLEKMKDEKDIQYLPCLHGLHDDCLKTLKNYSKLCPTCRNPITN